MLVAGCCRTRSISRITVSWRHPQQLPSGVEKIELGHIQLSGLWIVIRFDLRHALLFFVICAPDKTGEGFAQKLFNRSVCTTAFID